MNPDSVSENYASRRRSQWHDKAVLSLCSICFSGVSATVGAQNRHSAYDRTYETTSADERKYG